MVIKSLVAVACLVIITTGGFWLWQQYQAGEQAGALQARHASRVSCLAILDRHMSPSSSSSDTEYLSRDCIERGLITTADIDARK